MIEISSLTCNPIQENCFVVSDEGGETAVIDCGAYYDAERSAVVKHLQEQGLKLRHVLCTHAHFDHIFGLDTLYDTFGVKPRLHPADNFLYEGMDKQMRSMMGTGFDRTLPPLGDALADGETITLGSTQLQVLHTPGHSPGSVVFYFEQERTLFAGDTLFRMSVGRTDLEGGSWEELTQSIKQVLGRLPDDVRVFCGHGPMTTIGDEKRANPYFR